MTHLLRGITFIYEPQLMLDCGVAENHWFELEYRDVIHVSFHKDNLKSPDSLGKQNKVISDGHLFTQKRHSETLGRRKPESVQLKSMKSAGHPNIVGSDHRSKRVKGKLTVGRGCVSKEKLPPNTKFKSN